MQSFLITSTDKCHNLTRLFASSYYFTFQICHYNHIEMINCRQFTNIFNSCTFLTTSSIREVLNKKHSFCCRLIFRPFLRQIGADTTSYSRYLTVFLLRFPNKGQTAPMSGCGKFSSGDGKRIQIRAGEHGVQPILVFLQTTIHSFLIAERFWFFLITSAIKISQMAACKPLESQRFRISL